MSWISGVYAAVSIPRHADGRVDDSSLRRSIDFLLQHDIRGFVFNGATGEYCLTTPGELRSILAVAAEVLSNRAELACGIGSAGLRGCLEAGRLAMEAGAKLVLLPMPHFFPYEQDDLEAFCRQVAAELSLPILLYNLPQYTSGLAPATVQRLITECPNIVGIKDSSGSLEILRLLTRDGIDACRMVGNDSVLAAALREEVCDGVISGVAGVLPEVIQSLFGQRDRPDSVEFEGAARLLDEFIRQISLFPFPWGLKWIAEIRGMAPATFALPVSERRCAQSRELLEWFLSWRSSAGAETARRY